MRFLNIGPDLKVLCIGMIYTDRPNKEMHIIKLARFKWKK